MNMVGIRVASCLVCCCELSADESVDNALETNHA